MTTTEAQLKVLGLNQLDDALKLYRRFVNWHLAVNQYIESGYTSTPPNPRRLPSKDSKHAMYGKCGWLRQYLPIDVKRPSTLAEVADVLEAAERYLTGGVKKPLKRVYFD